MKLGRGADATVHEVDGNGKLQRVRMLSCCITEIFHLTSISFITQFVYDII